MKLFKLVLLLFAFSLAVSEATAQANPYINILTQNGGQVVVNGTVYIQVTVGNTGPVSPVPVNKLRTTVTVPIGICNLRPHAEQLPTLPAGWSITSTYTTGASITICNGSDAIPPGETRTLLLKVQGNTIGGPLTVLGQLSISSGSVCTGPAGGTIAGDNTADNSSTTAIQVINGCPLGVTASAGTITCNGGTTTLTATATGASGPIEYSITGGAPFQPGNTFTVVAGTYTVIAREQTNTNCTATSAPVTISQPVPVPAPVTAVVHPTCTLATGTITITSDTTGLKFSLDGGAYLTYTGGYNVPSGAHTLRAQDANGCLSAITNITVNVQPPTPAAPTVGTITHPTCILSTGSVVLNGLPAGNWTINPGAVTGNTPSAIINGLATGTYNYTVTNDVGCTSPVSANIIIDPQPPTPAAPTVGTIVHPTCTLSTGSVVLNGLPVGNWTINPGAITGNTVSATINNLAAGTYNYTVTNAVGCTSPASANIIINPQPVTPPAPTVGTITQPTCAVSTGSVILNNLPAGNWTINPGGITGNTASTTINGLAAGTYSYTVTNAVGCTSPTSANIVINPVPGAPAAPTVSVTQPTCTVATATIIITSNTVGVDFSLDGAGYGPYPVGGYTLIPPGPHTITLRNAASCISPVTNIIIDPQPPTPAAPTISVVQPTCTVPTGIITITSDTSGLKFSLDAGAYVPYPGPYPVSTGPHTLTAQNASGCISSVISVTINPQPVTPAAPIPGTVTHPTCAVVTGSVVLSGLPSGSWVINPGAISGTGAGITVTGLAPATTYNFTVTNAVGCVSAPSANVVINPIAGTPPAPTVTIVQPTCTVATGSVTVTSVTAGFNFSFNGGAYGPYTGPYANLAPGTYTLTSQEISTSCISAVTSIIINPQPPTPAAPTVTVAQPSCTVATGTITITSATSGLNFSFNGGAYGPYTGPYTNLATGSYTLTAQNASNCISAVSTITINPQPPTPAAPTVTVVQPTCTVATGSITITSATSGLNFSLNGAAYAPYTTPYIVTAGTYTLTAQNASTCVSPVTTIVIDTQPPTPIAPTVAVVQPTCSVATGTVTITSSTVGLTFSLNGATYASYPAGGYQNLTPGAYTLTAQNISACNSAVINIIINPQPTSPTATLSGGTISCFQGTTTLTVTATGGTPPYQYKLNNGAFQSSNTFTVGAGRDTVTVIGTNLCTFTTIITITQPAVLTATAAVVPIPCNGGTTTLTATATGGTTPYQYSLNGGAYQTANTFTVGTGVQTVTIKDANGCTKTANAVTVTQPTVLKALADAPRITTCGGKSMVTITANGGRTPYTGTGTFLRGPGTWKFTVTDSSGCSADTTIAIEPPGCMDLEVFPNPSRNTININHSVAEAGAAIQIFKMDGALVLTKPITLDAFLTTIDISRLADAAYVLVFINGKDRKSIIFEKLTH